MAKINCSLDTETKQMDVTIDGEQIANVCNFSGRADMEDMYQSFGAEIMCYEEGENNVAKMTRYMTCASIRPDETVKKTKYVGVFKGKAKPEDSPLTQDVHKYLRGE